MGRLLRSGFVRQGLLVLSSTMLVNICGYAFHFIASRRLGPVHYGDLYALLTATGFITILTVSATTVIARLTAEFSAVHDISLVAAMLRSARRMGIVASCAIAAVAAILLVPISSFLSLTQPAALLSWIALVAATMIITPVRGIAQGSQDFRTYAASLAVEALGKVILGVGAIVAGFGTAGALLGQAVGVAVAWICAELLTHRRLPGTATRAFSINAGRIIATSGGVLASTLAVTALLSVDTLLAKHYLAPAEAGIYSVVALAGKIVLFAVGFVPMLLLPKATAAATRRERAFPLLVQSGIATVVIAGGVLVLYWLEPAFVVTLMAGNAFRPAAPYLLAYGAAMSLLAMTNTIVAYRIAVHRFEFVLPLLIVACGEAFGIAIHHRTISDIVAVVLTSQAVAVVACAVPWRRVRAIPERGRAVDDGSEYETNTDCA